MYKGYFGTPELCLMAKSFVQRLKSEFDNENVINTSLTENLINEWIMNEGMPSNQGATPSAWSSNSMSSSSEIILRKRCQVSDEDSSSDDSDIEDVERTKKNDKNSVPWPRKYVFPVSKLSERLDRRLKNLNKKPRSSDLKDIVQILLVNITEQYKM